MTSFPNPRRFSTFSTMAGVPRLVAAGATDVYVNLRAFDPGLSEPAATLERLVTAFAANR